MYTLAIAGYPCSALVRAYWGRGFQSALVSGVVRGLILLVVAYVLIAQTHRGRLVYKGAWLRPLALFWFLYLCRMVFDIYIADRSYGATAYTGEVSPVFYALLVTLCPMFGFLVRPSERELRLAATCSVALLAVVCVSTSLMEQSRHFLIATGRLGLAELNPISLGQCGTTLVVLSLHLMLTSARRGRIISICLGIGCCLFGSYTIIGSGSRGPVVSLAAAVAALAWWMTRNLSLRRISTLGLAAGALVAIGIAVFGMDLPAVKPAIEHGTDMLIGRTEADIVQGEQYSRSRVTRAAITQFMENPIFGSGMAEQETGDYPHNLWIEAFMATGVVGGVAMLVVTLEALKACMLVIKTQRQGAWVGLIFLQYLVAGLFSGAIWGSTAFWCFAVGTVSLAVLRAPKRAAGPLARERVLPDLG